MTLAEPDPRWALEAAAEIARLRAVLGDVAIEHIGSTAVPGLVARPVIDLLVALPAPLPSEAATALASAGYRRERRRTPSGRTYFSRGLPRSHCLHVAAWASAEWREALAFRDHLRADPGAAARYAAVKRAAPADPGGYARAKARFVVAAVSALNEKGRVAATLASP